MTGLRSAAGVEPVVRGLRDPRRLAAVAETRRQADVASGDLHAVLGTLLVDCGVPSAAICLVSPGVQTYPAQVGIGASRTVFDEDLCPFTEIVDDGRPSVIADLRQHPAYWRNPLVQQGRVVSFAGEPLLDDGMVLGAVSILDREPRKFRPDQITVLRQLARLAGSLLGLHRQGTGDSATSAMQPRDDRCNKQPGSFRPGFYPAVHQATGRLMARFSVTPAEALERLHELADRLNRRLSEVAQDLALGNLPAPEERLVSAVGPTADTDLVLLGQHIASPKAEAADGLPDGPS